MQERSTSIATPSEYAPADWQQVSEEDMVRDP